jgi:adenine-specific DNA methylase
MEALEHLQGEVDIIYADPPYTRDHYSRFYHVLETLCLRDDPKISTVRIGNKDFTSRGIYRQNRHQSPFCIKSQAPTAFLNLFRRVRQLNVPLVISYSPYISNSNARPRLMTIQEIEELARKYFARVNILSAGRIAHSKLNSTDKNTSVSYDAEVIIKCEI